MESGCDRQSGDGMRILAAGRASEILDIGNGRVLRRFRLEGDPNREAELMRQADAHGFPVPRVHEVRRDGLVLDRVAGPTMAAEVRANPSRLQDLARILARLHDELHCIPMGEGVLVHLDLHWKNVLLSPHGPVVIDWANADIGDPRLDDALTWVILMTSSGALGREFAGAFARHVDVLSALGTAAGFRLGDRNLTDAERSRVERLLADHRHGE